MKRAFAVMAAVLAVSAGVLSARAQGKADEITVYKDPTCGCCANWVAHLEKAGFKTKVIETAEVDAIKDKNGVPRQARSCHTGVIDGLVVEGHVPAADLRRALKERPRGVIGLAVPGMPMGSPGMEVGTRVQPYNVVAFDKDGKTQIFASHGQ